MTLSNARLFTVQTRGGTSRTGRGTRRQTRESTAIECISAIRTQTLVEIRGN